MLFLTAGRWELYWVYIFLQRGNKTRWFSPAFQVTPYISELLKAIAAGSHCTVHPSLLPPNRTSLSRRVCYLLALPSRSPSPLWDGCAVNGVPESPRTLLLLLLLQQETSKRRDTEEEWKVSCWLPFNKKKTKAGGVWIRLHTREWDQHQKKAVIFTLHVETQLSVARKSKKENLPQAVAVIYSCSCTLKKSPKFILGPGCPSVLYMRGLKCCSQASDTQIPELGVQHLTQHSARASPARVRLIAVKMCTCQDHRFFSHAYKPLHRSQSRPNGVQGELHVASMGCACTPPSNWVSTGTLSSMQPNTLSQ